MTSFPNINLNNDIEMPCLGLGVWQIADGDEVESTVRAALDCGYRLIDTATLYGNECGVGRAIRMSGVPREEIFVTTKLWNSDHGYDEALAAFDASLKRLGLDYIDLYLIHWPAGGRIEETWEAFEKLYADKRVRAIGVSNFEPDHLKALLKKAKVMPAVNQIELHPRRQQHETRDFCCKHNIRIESYSPLMRGGEVLENPIIDQIACRHGKTPAQIIIRWHIQNGFIAIPKSVHIERIRENCDVFDFELEAAEMAAINDTG